MLFRVDVDERHIREECRDRLTALYGARDGAHLERLIVEDGFAALAGDLEAVARRAEVARLGNASKRLRAMTPIPANYTDAKWWAAPTVDEIIAANALPGDTPIPPANVTPSDPADRVTVASITVPTA